MKWKVTRMCWEPGFLARVKEDADMIARKLNQKETSLLTFEMVCFLKKKNSAVFLERLGNRINSMIAITLGTQTLNGMRGVTKSPKQSVNHNMSWGR